MGYNELVIVESRNFTTKFFYEEQRFQFACYYHTFHSLAIDNKRMLWAGLKYAFMST